MIEPELKVELDQINQKLESMDRALNPTRWQMFVQGLWRAVGYITGIVIAALILGWVLNMIGLIPFLKDFSQEAKEVLETVKR